MQKIRYISHYLFIGLIPFILLMFVNASVNIHVHKLSTGEVIVHSHPFQQSAGNSSSNHTHTEKELELLALTGNSVILILLIFSGLILFLFSFRLIINIRSYKLNFSEYFYIINNKAPPVFKLHF